MFNYFLRSDVLECGLPSIFSPPVFLLFPLHHPVSRLQAADRPSPSEADTGRDALVPFFIAQVSLTMIMML